MGRFFTLHGFQEPKEDGKKDKRKDIKALELESIDPPNEVDSLVSHMIGNAVGGGLNPDIDAGYTYFGQLLAHDISYFKQLSHGANPLLELHSLYGMGPDKSGYLYNYKQKLEDDQDSPYLGALMNFWQGLDGNGNIVYDLNRVEDGMPIIGDSRNDENFILSQLHLLFLRFHNKCVQEIHKKTGASSFQLYKKARKLVIWHYQLIILKEYLPLIVGKQLVNELLEQPKKHFKIYDPNQSPVLKKQFSEAVFRMGHSQVRNTYKLNSQNLKVPLFSADDSKAIDLGGFKRDLQRNIDWEFFFTLAENHQAQKSRAIDHKVAFQLHHLPFSGIEDENLAKINIHRSNDLSLKSEGLLEIFKDELDDMNFLLAKNPYSELREAFKQILGRSFISVYELSDMPLWLFILAEAEICESGRSLGPIGGRIVAEQIIWIMMQNTESIFSKRIYKNCTYSITDLIKYVEAEGEAQSNLFCKELYHLI